MKHRELFWAKLQFQIQHHLSHFHCYGRELTVDRLLCDIGIFDGHRHFNISAIPLLTSVHIPEGRYWRHWWKYWKYHTWRHCEPSECNVVLGILTFSLYVSRVCNTCRQELENQSYRIASTWFGAYSVGLFDGLEFMALESCGSQGERLQLKWRRFQAAMDSLISELGR